MGPHQRIGHDNAIGEIHFPLRDQTPGHAVGMIAIVIASAGHGVTGAGEVGETAGVRVVRHLQRKFVKALALQLLTNNGGGHPGIFEPEVAVVILVSLLLVIFIRERIFAH